MAGPSALDVVFFDIGNTLGERDSTGRFIAYPSSAALLSGLRTLELRLGVITNLSPLPDESGWNMLVQAGLSEFFSRDLFVTDRSAGVAKPDPAVFRFALRRAGVVAPERGMFIGEDVLELLAAASIGMRTFWKPKVAGNDLPV